MRKMHSYSILDLGKCPNRKTHDSESACFLVGALPEVQNWIWKHFSHKVLYYYNSKKNQSILANDKQSQKKDFLLYFQILRSRDQGFFFLARKLFFPQMACIDLLNNRGGHRSLYFVITTYSYPLLITIHVSRRATNNTFILPSGCKRKSLIFFYIAGKLLGSSLKVWC